MTRRSQNPLAEAAPNALSVLYRLLLALAQALPVGVSGAVIGGAVGFTVWHSAKFGWRVAEVVWGQLLGWF